MKEVTLKLTTGEVEVISDALAIYKKKLRDMAAWDDYQAAMYAEMKVDSSVARHEVDKPDGAYYFEVNGMRGIGYVKDGIADYIHDEVRPKPFPFFGLDAEIVWGEEAAFAENKTKPD